MREIFVSLLIKRVWQKKYVTLVDIEDLSLLLMNLNIQETFLKTSDGLILGVLVDLHVGHDYIYLRLLINLFPDLTDAISRKLDDILHFLVHLALVAYKHNM